MIVGINLSNHPPTPGGLDIACQSDLKDDRYIDGYQLNSGDIPRGQIPAAWQRIFSAEAGSLFSRHKVVPRKNGPEVFPLVRLCQVTARSGRLIKKIGTVQKCLHHLDHSF
ncbi:MAG TPA: hypothetical protein VK564_07335, partial [Thermodesulfobacteriota bacterium]|nr:hypothetical protein [Thermodesulfobacteriota bacterium]